MACIYLIPPQNVLNKLEKWLLGNIQVFLTMIILPGGQYTEKGLVLNLFVNFQVVANQLQSVSDVLFCAVKFHAGSPRVKNMGHMIRPNMLYNAFKCLQRSNHLYAEHLPSVMCAPSPTESECVCDADGDTIYTFARICFRQCWVRMFGRKLYGTV